MIWPWHTPVVPVEDGKKGLANIIKHKRCLSMDHCQAALSCALIYGMGACNKPTYLSKNLI
jgi:hypothetical protein